MISRAFSAFAIGSLLVSVALAQEATRNASPSRLPEDVRLSRIDLRDVKVGGEIGRRIDVTVENNLLVLDVDKDFLTPFQEKKAGSGYIGLGKLIDAAARLAAYTGDERVIARKRHLVEEAIKTQEPDGYMGILRPDARMWTLWDIHEMGYLVYGLVTDYRLFGEKDSLEAARKLADYIVRRWSAEPDRKPGGGSITVHMAVTGVESAMLALYGQTNDKRYLDFVVTLRKLPEWQDRIVIGRWGQIEGHAYAHVCRCIAQLRLHAITDDQRLLGASRRVVDFLTRHDGLVITGTCGDHECWHDTQEGTVNLGETCTVAYLVRFLDELLRLEGDTRYGDLAERAVYNALFAAQSPDGRRIRYYTPFDGPRKYHDADTYCCPCNYRRIIAELPELIYYRAERGNGEGNPAGVFVNLYTASQAKVALADGLHVELRQHTDYPHSGSVTLEVTPSKSAEFPVWLRIPRWCHGAKVAVNGKAVDGPASAGSACMISRRWQPGDKLTLEMPMSWRLVQGRKAQAGRVAVMRGPLVFCLNPDQSEKLKDVDLRLIVIDPESLEGPFEDQSVHPGGLACRVKAWSAGKWYPMAKPDLTLTLTEYADPGGEAVYLKLPNPRGDGVVEDELVETAGK